MHKNLIPASDGGVTPGGYCPKVVRTQMFQAMTNRVEMVQDRIAVAEFAVL